MESKTKKVIIIIIILLVVAGVVLGLVFGLKGKGKSGSGVVPSPYPPGPGPTPPGPTPPGPTPPGPGPTPPGPTPPGPAPPGPAPPGPAPPPSCFPDGHGCVSPSQCCHKYCSYAGGASQTCNASPSCVGASCKIIIMRNDKKQQVTVGKLIEGDKLKSFNFKTKKIFWDTLYWSKRDGDKLVEHYKFITEDNGELIATKEHLLYKDTSKGPKLTRTDKFKEGDYLLKWANGLKPVKITEIKMINDIPISPMTIHGNFILGTNNILVSCFSHTEKNAKNIQKYAYWLARIITLLPSKTWAPIAKFLYNFIIKPRTIKNR